MTAGKMWMALVKVSFKIKLCMKSKSFKVRVILENLVAKHIFLIHSFQVTWNREELAEGPHKMSPKKGLENSKNTI